MFKIFEGGEFLPDFTKDIHCISWTPYACAWGGYELTGYTGMAWSYYVTFSTLGISEKANITIMPDCRNYSDQEIYTHFNDALKCQNNLVSDIESVIYGCRFPDDSSTAGNIREIDEFCLKS